MKRTATLLMVFSVALTAMSAHADNDDYAEMLGYLASTRIDGNAMRGTSGASAVNMAAGDFNQQASVRAIATGGGTTSVQASQQQHGNKANAPDIASASIGGNAYAGGNGLASINQASGNSNAQLNLVAASLAKQGIRETTDDALSTDMSASAGGHHPTEGNQASKGGSLSVAVESSAMHGYQGVMQLNQSAGSDNVTSNQLMLSLPASPH